MSPCSPEPQRNALGISENVAQFQSLDEVTWSSQGRLAHHGHHKGAQGHQPGGLLLHL